MIIIVDYGVGNLNSVQNMLRKSKADSIISNDAQEILNAERIILPGVGAFDSAMQKLNDMKLADVIKTRARNGGKILGICLGAQLLLNGSDEGKLPGLGLINGWCRKFDAAQIAPLKVPHMGWTEIKFTKPNDLSVALEVNPRFYFVHSYHMTCETREDVLATSVYGHEFVCAVNRRNVSGVQFHPEKSHQFGVRLLANFAGTA